MVAAQSAVHASSYLLCCDLPHVRLLPSSHPTVCPTWEAFKPERTLCISGGARQEGIDASVQHIAMQRYCLLLQQ